MKLQFPHCTYETISDFNLLCYKWRFAIAEFTMKTESGTRMFSNCLYTNIFSYKTFLSLNHQKHSLLERQLIPLSPWEYVKCSCGPHCCSAQVFKADKGGQSWGYHTKISQHHCHSVCPFAGLDDDLDYQSVCVSVTLCLGEHSCKHSYTDSSYLGSDCNRSQQSYKFGREAMEAGWILALSPLHSSHYNWTACGLLQFLDVMSQY